MSNKEEPKEEKNVNKNEKKCKNQKQKKESKKIENKVKQEKKDDKKENKKRNEIEKPIIKEKTENVKEEKTKEVTRKEQLEIAEIVKDELKLNKKLPEEQEIKINDKVFPNICMAIAIMVYLLSLLLGFQKIDNSIFLTDLKVFGFCILIIAILVFEKAYKKDSNSYVVYGIEILIFAITTLALIYVNIMIKDKFILITSICSFIFSIYYIGKSIFIYLKMKKKYFINKMKEITKK